MCYIYTYNTPCVNNIFPKSPSNPLQERVCLSKFAIYAEKFEARKQTWAKWEYDKNDKWVVIAPTCPLDLAQEGIELHHCVRSFIPDVAEGKTNIVFIREKGKEETPFFTIEILNDGKVRQIHGMCNCNASSEPGLEDFIKEWGKAVKANLKEYNHCLAPR